MAGIYTLLKRDHDQLKPMLEDLGMGHERKLETLRSELKAHSEAEEKIFYAALEGDSEAREMVAEGRREHEQADMLAQKLAAAAGDIEAFRATATQLREAILHHVQEEEGRMFTRAQKVLDEQQAESLGWDFERRKQELLGKLPVGAGVGAGLPGAGGLRDSEETSMQPEDRASFPGR